jgi:DNA-binding CsgD family transcriptional regulator
MEKRAVARLQTLCCLGLGGPLAIPAALAELHGLVASGGNEFYWADADLQMGNVYMESANFAVVSPLYFQVFHDRRDRETRLSFSELMRTPFASPVDDFFHRTLKVPLAEFRRTDVYNLVLRPLGAEKRLQAKVTEQGRPLGVLHLNRSARDPDFSARDRRLLTATIVFLAHAMREAAPEAGAIMETEDRAVVIARADGRIEALSPSASRLLQMARYARFFAAADWSSATTLPAPVAALCRSLAAVLEERPQHAAPVWQHRNPWGCFTFRAYPVTSKLEPGADLFTIFIEREVPLRLRLYGRLNRLDLSPREQQFCLLAIDGQRRDDIAERMGVSLNTAIAHARSVYAKLGVRNRTELIERLRALN